jgi:DNA-binding PadR family transcriptional regulator
MNIQHVILGFLMNEPMSGYDIKRRFEVSASHFFEASFGGIYPALRKMEKEGLIDKQVVIQEGKPNKNVFAITDLGKQAFYEYLASPLEPSMIRSDFLVRVFFGRHASKEQIRSWMAQELANIERNLRDLEQTKAQVYEKLDWFQKFTLDFGIAHSSFAVEWVKRYASQLESEE